MIRMDSSRHVRELLISSLVVEHIHDLFQVGLSFSSDMYFGGSVAVGPEAAIQTGA